MKALTQEQFDFFSENGFLFPIPALTEIETKACLAGLPGWRRNSAVPSPMRS